MNSFPVRLRSYSQLVHLRALHIENATMQSYEHAGAILVEPALTRRLVSPA